MLSKEQLHQLFKNNTPSTNAELISTAFNQFAQIISRHSPTISRELDDVCVKLRTLLRANDLADQGLLPQHILAGHGPIGKELHKFITLTVAMAANAEQREQGKAYANEYERLFAFPHYYLGGYPQFEDYKRLVDDCVAYTRVTKLPLTLESPSTRDDELGFSLVVEDKVAKLYITHPMEGLTFDSGHYYVDGVFSRLQPLAQKLLTDAGLHHRIDETVIHKAVELAELLRSKVNQHVLGNLKPLKISTTRTERSTSLIGAGYEITVTYYKEPGTGEITETGWNICYNDGSGATWTAHEPHPFVINWRLKALVEALQTKANELLQPID